MKIQNKSEPAEMNLFGVIGGGIFEEGFDEASVAEALKDLDPSAPLDVYVNSVGGVVDCAVAINGLLARRKGAVTIHVTGLAASAATLITSTPGAKVLISPGSLMMIHNPSTIAMGDADELEQQAEVLNKHAEALRAIYKARTGKDDAELKAMMDAETWMTASEAVEHGFADAIEQTEPVTACLKGAVLAIAGRHFTTKSFNNLEKLKEAIMAEIPERQEPEQAPEVVNEAPPVSAEADPVQTAVMAERARIKALLEIEDAQNHDLVFDALFEHPRNVEAVAVEILKRAKARTQAAATALAADAHEIADAVDKPVAEGALPDKGGVERQALVDSVHAELKKLINR